MCLVVLVAVSEARCSGASLSLLAQAQCGVVQGWIWAGGRGDRVGAGTGTTQLVQLILLREGLRGEQFVL